MRGARRTRDMRKTKGVRSVPKQIGLGKERMRIGKREGEAEAREGSEVEEGCLTTGG